MHVEVVRSNRRRKTVELRPTANGVRISIPSSASAEEEEKYVNTLLRRYERRRKTQGIELEPRARQLAERYGLSLPTSIHWVQNQNTRWGSCTPATGTVRISSAVAAFPAWVVDYVIVHELAHLSVLGHGPKFWQLVERYPKTERARGFLIAKGLEDPEADDESPLAH